VALGEGLLDEDVDGDAVLGVHADERADLAGALHGAEDLPVVDEEDAGVGHEELEARDPLVDELCISAAVPSFTSVMIMWKP
jgi:hypothetical protein